MLHKNIRTCGLAFLLLGHSFGLGFHIPLQDGLAQDNDEEVPTISIIDILSSNESYTSLILTLQRSDLVDYVNELTNVTFLAPVNSAFDRHDIPRGSKMSKNQLNKFIINSTIFREDINGICILDTLGKGSPYIENLNIPILLEHRFVDGEDHETYMVENANVIGDDVYMPAFDNILLSVDDLMIDDKESVCRYFLNSLNRNTGDERFKTFSSLIVSENTCRSEMLSNMTFLVPSDKSLSFNHVEIKYLNNVRGLHDKNLFLSNFLVDGIIGGNLNNAPVVTHNWNNNEVKITSSYLGDEIIINDKYHATTSNFLLADGIIHYFDSFEFDQSFESYPRFTPRKYLIGLDYDEFVDELDFRKLSHLIDDASLNQTIFVSIDYKIMGALQNQMYYHFVEGNNIDSLQPGESRLLTSKFCLTEEFCQKIKIQRITDTGSLVLNSNVNIVNTKPYKVGNTSIYILEDDISLPAKLQIAIASELTKHGKSISYFKEFSLLKELSRGDSFHTIFFPASKLWEDLDVTLEYMENNPSLLQEILEGLVIEGLIYDNFEGTQLLQTYGGDVVNITTINKGLLQINNSTLIKTSFDNEILYSNGVIHPVYDELPLPKTLDISVFDLLQDQSGDIFEKILEKTNLTGYLALPDYSILLPPDKSLLQENITEMVGDYDYLDKFVKLHILPPGAMDMILNCHSNQPLDSNSTTMIPTILEGHHLTCRQLSSGGIMLSITEGANNEVRILRKGSTINVSELKSGILILDRPLSPRWLNKNPGKLYLHLPFLAVIVGILIGVVCVIFGFGCCLLITLGSNSMRTADEEESENVAANSSHIANVNERLPLLSENVGGNNINEHDNNGIGQGSSLKKVTGKPQKNYSSFESRYSANASTSPIEVIQE